MSTPHYYCYPPVFEHPGWDETLSPHVWLVTDLDCLAPGPGLYTSWHRVQALTEGRHDPVYFERQEDAYPEWHLHCRLGEHNHPVDPDPSNARPPFNYGLQSPSQTFQSPARTVPQPSPHPPTVHFAVRGGEVVYKELDKALQHYVRVSATSSTAELMATNNAYKAVFFARGEGEAKAEQLARAHGANGDPFFTTGGVVQCGSMSSPVSPPSRSTYNAATSSTSTASRVDPIPAPVFSAAQCTVRRDPNSSRTRMPSIDGAVQECKRKEEEQQKRATVSRARRAAIESALTSTPKASTPKEVKLEVQDFGLKGKGKAVEDNGEETDYDVDEDFLRVASGWVPVDERFDPRTENQPRDDA
ncbi:hypothetical protein B0H16DRAFT_1879706 [Mycena metata]|uniref:Uncharacterized protein n=1 Tax=Mycena metata TaxID=1033252 RepID=A0AAD7K1K8_9AGAR|nr:hypothetical protein B0H16DRAFT_1879706 [Mycena metata]